MEGQRVGEVRLDGTQTRGEEGGKDHGTGRGLGTTTGGDLVDGGLVGEVVVDAVRRTQGLLQELTRERERED